MIDSWIPMAAGALLAIAAIVAMRLLRTSRRRERIAAALAAFDPSRPELAAQFLAAAAATGKPRGLRWKACELSKDMRFAVDRASGELYALVSATVSFEAIEGGDMEEVEAVGNLRSATAVFVHRGGEWTSDGRVVFNLDPEQTLERYADTLESPHSDATKS